jgi:hypothetical protein
MIMAGCRLANSSKARSGRVPTPAQVSIGADISTPRDCGQITEARRAPTNFGTAPAQVTRKKFGYERCNGRNMKRDNQQFWEPTNHRRDAGCRGDDRDRTVVGAQA